MKILSLPCHVQLNIVMVAEVSMECDATLIYKGTGTDDDGFDIESITGYEVYASVESVKRTEFYSAMQAGMKPAIMMSVRAEDYEQTKHIVDKTAVYAQAVELDGAEYNIIRAYTADNGMVELTLGS